MSDQLPKKSKGKKEPKQVPKSLEYYWENLKADWFHSPEDSFLYSYFYEKCLTDSPSKKTTKVLKDSKDVKEIAVQKAKNFIYDINKGRLSTNLLTIEMLMAHCQRKSVFPNKLLYGYDFKIEDKDIERLKACDGDFVIPLMIEKSAMVSLCLRKKHGVVRYIIVSPPFEQVYRARIEEKDYCNFYYGGSALDSYEKALHQFYKTVSECQESIYSTAKVRDIDQVPDIFKKYFEEKEESVLDQVISKRNVNNHPRLHI